MEWDKTKVNTSELDNIDWRERPGEPESMTFYEKSLQYIMH